MLPAISAVGLSKRYALGRNAETTLRTAVARLVTSRLTPRGAALDEIWALRDVSFEVQPGEVVGVIGRNGSGKTTLLKILARITTPTRGQADIRGHLAAILGVGAGFQPTFTGRENIYLSGALLGMRRNEIDERFDAIVAFAEIERFLDTAVRRYSSGMYVRLAFSVAAHLRSDILLIDEALAVGDAAFRRKCTAKMREIVSEGRTIVIVSHDVSALEGLATRTLLLEGGGLIASGATPAIVEQYLRQSADDIVPAGIDAMHLARASDLPRDIEIVHIAIEGGELQLRTDQRLLLRLTLRARAAAEMVRVNFTVHRARGGAIGSVTLPARRSFEPGVSESLRIEMPDLRLAAGLYTLSVDVHGRSESATLLDALPNVLRFEVLDPSDDGAAVWRGARGPIRYEAPRVERLHDGD